MNMEYTLLPDGTYAAGIMAYYDNDDEVLADQFRVLTIKNGSSNQLNHRDASAGRINGACPIPGRYQTSTSSS